jgi:hypothetical protein
MTKDLFKIVNRLGQTLVIVALESLYPKTLFFGSAHYLRRQENIPNWHNMSDSN